MFSFKQTVIRTPGSELPGSWEILVLVVETLVSDIFLSVASCFLQQLNMSNEFISNTSRFSIGVVPDGHNSWVLISITSPYRVVFWRAFVRLYLYSDIHMIWKFLIKANVSCFLYLHYLLTLASTGTSTFSCFLKLLNTPSVPYCLSCMLFWDVSKCLSYLESLKKKCLNFPKL